MGFMGFQFDKTDLIISLCAGQKGAPAVLARRPKSVERK